MVTKKLHAVSSPSKGICVRPLIGKHLFVVQLFYSLTNSHKQPLNIKCTLGDWEVGLHLLYTELHYSKFELTKLNNLWSQNFGAQMLYKKWEKETLQLQ